LRGSSPRAEYEKKLGLHTRGGRKEKNSPLGKVAFQGLSYRSCGFAGGNRRYKEPELQGGYREKGELMMQRIYGTGAVALRGGGERSEREEIGRVRKKKRRALRKGITFKMAHISR